MKRSDTGMGCWTRRDILKSAVAVVWVVPAFAQARGGQRGPAAAPQTGNSAILLGTQGGPGVSATRTQASNAVIVDGRTYLVDCGYGALKSAVQAGLTLGMISNVFITHLHDDHTADIAALLALKWTASQTPGEATIYGPTAPPRWWTRQSHSLKPMSKFEKSMRGVPLIPKPFSMAAILPPPKITEVFKDDRVAVQSVENTHFPDRAKAKMDYRSFSYRFNHVHPLHRVFRDTAYSEKPYRIGARCRCICLRSQRYSGRSECAGSGAECERYGKHRPSRARNAFHARGRRQDGGCCQGQDGGAQPSGRWRARRK